MRVGRLWIAVVTSLAVSVPLGAWGQGCAPTGPMSGMKVGGEPVQAAARPVRMEGIGNATIEITTSNPEARAWFTQGLNLLHDFWDYESERAFRESVRLDPGCAMCWWGLAEAQQFRGEDSAAAKVALKRAKDLEKKARPAERLYIEASVQEGVAREREGKAGGKEEAAAADKGGKEAKAAREAREDKEFKESKATGTLRKLVAMRPEEVEARVFLAESLMNGFHEDGTPKAGTAAGQAVLREVLAAHPEDSAANHYWIHAVEPGNHPELALESARKLGEMAPASGHMVHMPGHIFYRTGDYGAAGASFERSMAVDEAYMREQHVAVDHDWNYVHNMMYLIADLLEEGRVAEATTVSAKLNGARGETAATLYRFSTRDGLTRLNVALPVVLRGGEWARAAAMLEGSKPDARLATMIWLRGALLDYVQGMAALEAGDGPRAAKYREALDAAIKVEPAEKGMAGMGHPMPAMASGDSKDLAMKPVRSFMDVAATELRGSELMAEGKRAEADAAFGRAAEAERALGYHEPPNYIRPVEETRGDALMRAGRYAEAKAAYESALKERPNSGYPLYGIARAEAAAGDEAGARAAFGKMLAAWKGADAGLPQVVAARGWIAAHGAGATGGAQ